MSAVEVNLDSGLASVTAEKEISMDTFASVIEDAGYTLVK